MLSGACCWEGRFYVRAASSVNGDLASQLVVDMGANDLVERRLGLEAERERAARYRTGPASRRRSAQPAGRFRGGCATRPCRRQSGATTAICSATVQQTPGMVRLMRGPSASPSSPAAWTRKPTAARGLACQLRTLSSTGSTASSPLSGSRMIEEKKPGRGLVRPAGPHDDVRQPDADAIEEATAGVIGEHQFDHRLLGAVRGQRRQGEIVRDRYPETAHRKPRSTRRRQSAGNSRAPVVANGIEKHADAVEIDVQRLSRNRVRLLRKPPRRDGRSHPGGPRWRRVRCRDRRYRPRWLRRAWKIRRDAAAGRRRGA